jgi:biotin transporter BioY
MLTGKTMGRKSLTGAVLAAVGAMFLTTPVFAQGSSGNSSLASIHELCHVTEISHSAH